MLLDVNGVKAEELEIKSSERIVKEQKVDAADGDVAIEEVIEVVVISEAPTTKKTSKDLKTKLKGRTRGTMIGPNIYRDE